MPDSPWPPPTRDPLAHQAATRPTHVALEADARRWDYAGLDAEVSGMARRLLGALARGGHDASAAPAPRIASLLPNNAEPAFLVHASARAGAVLVPLNTRLSAAELAWQLGDARPALLVAHAQTAPLAAAALAELDEAARPRLVVADGAMLLDTAQAAGVALPPWPAPDAVRTIVYTSGTTGRPKGALLTFANHWASADASARNLGVRRNDRWLACLPIFHVGGQAILLRAALYGITAVVHDGFDAVRVNRAIDEDGVTHVSLVGATLQRLLEARGDRAAPPTLRCVLLGGGPAPRALLERAVRAGIPVVQTYGLTETASQVATLAPAEALARVGSAGRALPPNEVRVAHTDGRALPTGEAGEILVRGPVVMAGYLDRPAESARALAGGWLHTGDVGTLDADGYLTVLDRRDDLIVSGGENVYPAEVEAALLALPDVAEAGVIGVADARWGQRVVAVVRGRDGAAVNGEALRAACRAQLAGYKVPAEIRVVGEALPRTASGKLRRAALRDGWAGG